MANIRGLLMLLVIYIAVGAGIHYQYGLSPELSFACGVVVSMAALVPIGWLLDWLGHMYIRAIWEDSERGRQAMFKKINWPKFEWPVDGDTIKYFVPAALGIVTLVWLCNFLFQPGEGFWIQAAKTVVVLGGSSLAFYAPFRLFDRIWP